MPRIITSEVRVSNVFYIRTGKQLTLQAVGLQGDDYVIVEVLGLDRARLPAQGNFCCDSKVPPSEIISITPLRCRNGARVILTRHFPFATLTSPQNTPLRARVVADVTAVITVDAEETEGSGCDVCACVEPYCASYPMPGGGYGFVDGDMKDPEATVDVQACDGQGPVAWIFPTARPGATAPQYDCTGALIGYAENRSECSIATSEAVPCVAKTTQDRSVAEDQGVAALPAGLVAGGGIP